jgi:hypothetical protein
MRSHAKPLPPATDPSDTIGAFWMVPLPLRKYRDDGLVDVPAALAAAQPHPVGWSSLELSAHAGAIDRYRPEATVPKRRK